MYSAVRKRLCTSASSRNYCSFGLAQSNENGTRKLLAITARPWPALDASSRQWVSPSTTMVRLTSSVTHQHDLGVPGGITAGKNNLSSCAAVAYEEEPEYQEEYDITNVTNKKDQSEERKHHYKTEEKHCRTCTCVEEEPKDEFALPFCGKTLQEEPLPPPLPEPRISVHKRVLPSTLTALSSTKGRKMLLEALHQNMAESYWSLSEQFVNQSDPAYCGITTLMMVLNAMCVDPLVRWRGGWRFYGDEDVLLDRCCMTRERIRRVGITVDEFRSLGKCQGLRDVILRQPPPAAPETDKEDDITSNEDDGRGAAGESLETFRQDIARMVQGGPQEDEEDQHNVNVNNGFLVVSFARSALGQTGEGHFSPIAAYHQETDQVLLLDVARFKYAPYWVSVEDLYHAMQPLDATTQKPRGWFLLYPPPTSSHYEGPFKMDEKQRPASLVREVGKGDICPAGKIKVEYCPAAGQSKPEKMGETENPK